MDNFGKVADWILDGPCQVTETSKIRIVLNYNFFHAWWELVATLETPFFIPAPPDYRTHCHAAHSGL
jgi:hypothetical protein